MKQIFKLDKVKGLFFLTTLLDIIDHIINNIGTRGLTTFTKIELKMLNISKKHSLDIVNLLAYYTLTRRT
jgi:hypothetical protein